jgi:hypothetical protein
VQQVYYSAGKVYVWLLLMIIIGCVRGKELAVLLLAWYGKTWGGILCFNTKHGHFSYQACPSVGHQHDTNTFLLH